MEEEEEPCKGTVTGDATGRVGAELPMAGVFFASHSAPLDETGAELLCWRRPVTWEEEEGFVMGDLAAEAEEEESKSMATRPMSTSPLTAFSNWYQLR